MSYAPSQIDSRDVSWFSDGGEGGCERNHLSSPTASPPIFTEHPTSPAFARSDIRRRVRVSPKCAQTPQAAGPTFAAAVGSRKRGSHATFMDDLHRRHVGRRPDTGVP